jgi:hypothetical protein
MGGPACIGEVSLLSTKPCNPNRPVVLAYRLDMG